MQSQIPQGNRPVCRSEHLEQSEQLINHWGYWLFQMKKEAKTQAAISKFLTAT